MVNLNSDQVRRRSVERDFLMVGFDPDNPDAQQGAATDPAETIILKIVTGLVVRDLLTRLRDIDRLSYGVLKDTPTGQDYISAIDAVLGTDWQDGGGGQGGVSNSRFLAEQQARASGDVVEYIQVANVTQLRTDLAAQVRETTAKIFHLLQDMTHDSTDFKWGDTLLVPPGVSTYDRGPNIPLAKFTFRTHVVDTKEEFEGYVNAHVGSDDYIFLRARGSFTATLLRNEAYAVVAGETYWVYPRNYEPHRFISFTELANAAGYSAGIAITTAANTDAFAAAVRGHRTSADSAKRLYIRCSGTYTAFVGADTYPVTAGDVWVVDPMGSVPYQFLPIPALLNIGGYSNDRMSIEPVNGLPGIDAVSSLDGNYWLQDPDVARGIDISEATRWTLNIVGSDGIINSRTQIHEVDPWVPNKTIRAVVNISDTEEANVQTALASTPGRVRFALRVLNVNAQVLVRYYEMPINAAFVSGSSPGPAPAAKLTQAQEIGLLSIHPASSTIDYTPGKLDDALEGTLRLIVANPELLTGDIWVQGSVDGQPVLARRKWTAATGTLDFVISDQLSRLIGQNPALDIQLSFYNDAAASAAINLVETLRYSIDLQRLPRPLHQAVVVNSANTAVDADDGVTADLAMGFNTVLTISGGEDALYLTIRATQDATGNRTLTFGGTNLELSTAANARDRLLFQRRGNVWEFVGIIKAA